MGGELSTTVEKIL